MSSGNVFEDIGFEEGKATVKLLKSKLVNKIDSVIKLKRLKQEDAAAIMGINQPKVSALLRGKLSGFSLERLVRFLTALDVEVDVIFQDKQPVAPVKSKPGRPPKTEIDYRPYLFIEVEYRLMKNKEWTLKKAIVDIQKNSEESSIFKKKASKDIPPDSGPLFLTHEPYKASTLHKDYSNFVNDPQNQEFIARIRKLKLQTAEEAENFLVTSFNAMAHEFFSGLSSPPNE